jgi:hypothetical protein
MAVPARTRGVWHLRGDPLEMWLEARPDAIDAMVAGGVDVPCAAAPAALADALARASAVHEVFSYARTRRAPRRYDARIEVQARALVPLAVAHTAALLRAVPRSDTLRPA